MRNLLRLEELGLASTTSLSLILIIRNPLCCRHIVDSWRHTNTFSVSRNQERPRLQLPKQHTVNNYRETKEVQTVKF